jgi:glucose-1-phosphate thymidylyltransferase
LSSYAVIGIYFYDGSVFDRIRALKPSGRGEYEITDINNSYIEDGTLQHSQLEGWWTDAGTFESLWHASNMVREKVLRGVEEVAPTPHQAQQRRSLGAPLPVRGA